RRCGDDLRGLALQLLPQRARLDDIPFRPELEQHAQRSVLAVELQRHWLATPETVAERLEPRLQPRPEGIQQVPPAARADVQLDGEPPCGRIALEALAPLLPELLQVEVRVAR